MIKERFSVKGVRPYYNVVEHLGESTSHYLVRCDSLQAFIDNQRAWCPLSVVEVLGTVGVSESHLLCHPWFEIV